MRLEVTLIPAVTLGSGRGKMSEPVTINLPFYSSSLYSALVNFLSPYYPTSFHMDNNRILIRLDVDDVDRFLYDINWYFTEKEFTNISLPLEDLLLLKLYLPAGSQVNFFPLYESYRLLEI